MYADTSGSIAQIMGIMLGELGCYKPYLVKRHMRSGLLGESYVE
jgi:hypothetical protein